MAECVECGNRIFKRRIVYVCLKCGRVNSVKERPFLEKRPGDEKKE